MKGRLIFVAAVLGLLVGLAAAWYFGIERKPQPPAFPPVSNPFVTAIYANGIIESDQPGGSSINLFPEVAGPVTQVLVHEGQRVEAGTAVLKIDDTAQAADTEQLRLQAEAASALLDELRAQPRREALDIAKAQVELAEANLLTVLDQYEKRQVSADADPLSISRDVLDTAGHAVGQASAAVQVARRQYELTRAGAWSYDVSNQRKQVQALHQAYLSARAVLARYTVRARSAGVVLAVNTAPGSYVSSQGAYDAITQSQQPLVVMSAPQQTLAVRCYVDELLVSRLPAPDRIQAQMSIRGTDIKVPLEFVRVQPYVSPKIELSNQRQEKVDLRVLPVIFRFEKKDAPVYPGQLVDVYIGQK